MRVSFHPFHRHMLPWAVWGVAVLFCFYQFLIQVSPGVMVPELIRAFHIDAFKVSILSSLSFSAYLLLQMPAGALVDRFGARRIFIMGMIGFSAATFVFSLAQTYWLANVSRFFIGLFAAPGFVCTVYLIGRWFSPQRVTVLIGLTSACVMLGGAIGHPLLSVALQSFLGWRGAMLICALLGATLALGAWFLVHDKPSWLTEELPPNAPPESGLTVGQTIMEVLQLPSVWLLGLYAGLMFAAVNMFAALWAIPYLETYYQLPESAASFMTSLVYWGGAVATPIFSWLSERMGRRRPLMWVGALACFICSMLILYGPHLFLYDMLAMFILLGVLCSTYILAFAIIQDISPENLRATAIGFVNMVCFIIGGVLMQLLAGLLLEYKRAGSVIKGIAVYSLSDYQVALSLLPLGMLIAFCLVFFIPETFCRSWYAKPAELIDPLQETMDILEEPIYEKSSSSKQ